jgi:uncharacterized protein YbjT (DUF2867 family)
MDKGKKILVAGANGTTGRIIINLLKESENYEPIAMVRKQEQKDHFQKENVSVVLADLEKDLDHAVENIDKVIFAAGSGGKNVIGVDQEGAKRLIDASKKAKINKFVMLSSMGADNPSVSDELKDYLKAKQNADAHLTSSRLNYTIVRPGALTNKGRTGEIKLKEKLENQGSISRADVAQTLVEVLDNNVKKNETFEIVNGEVYIDKAVRSN